MERSGHNLFTEISFVKTKMLWYSNRGCEKRSFLERG